ncbi:MAG: hypothetical protein ACOYIK_05390 [Coriobacteriales bacterium]|jgi:hypothetical protein
MKKKVLSLVLTVFLACFAFGALAGCSSGSTSQYVGTWVADSADYGGQNYTMDDLGMTGSDLMTLELNSDGTCTLTSNASSTSASVDATWTETDSGITISDSYGDYSLDYDASTQNLIVGSDLLGYDGMTLYLVKQ